MSVKKSELCDPTIYEFEGIQIEGARDTLKEKKEVDDGQSEVDFETNTLISTFSVISHIVYVDIKEEESNVQQSTPLEINDEEITTV